MPIVVKRYDDNLYYPILVKFAGYRNIVEMQGKTVNLFNDGIKQEACYDATKQKTNHENH